MYHEYVRDAGHAGIMQYAKEGVEVKFVTNMMKIRLIFALKEEPC